MVPITIGVPVYNGAGLLEQSLACLARQTFGDFKVLIFDNASTDATADVARGWAARDDRFEHIRQVENVGGVANFRAALLAAKSPWFLWRADDDLSADNYIETLFSLATSSPGCKLAVGNVLSCDADGADRRLTVAPEIGAAPSALRTLFAYHPSWFYGLWDRRALIDAYLPVCRNYPFAYAADHLTLYGPIIDGVVRTTTKTEFVQRARPSPSRGTRMPFSVMVQSRLAFSRELSRMRAERRLPAGLRAALIASEPFYLERTVPSLLKTARTGLRELMGMTGPRKVGRHFD
jgi:glycosyltransferase involved in cell wall biosynthesis